MDIITDIAGIWAILKATKAICDFLRGLYDTN
jgi:hypothetical protein